MLVLTKRLAIASYTASRQNLSLKKSAKNYKNYINVSIWSSDEVREIIDIIPAHELHLILGVVNHLYNQCWQSSWMKTWNEQRNVMIHEKNLMELYHLLVSQMWKLVASNMFNTLITLKKMLNNVTLYQKINESINAFKRSYIGL